VQRQDFHQLVVATLTATSQIGIATGKSPKTIANYAKIYACQKKKKITKGINDMQWL